MTRPESDHEFVARALSELPECSPSAQLRRKIAEIPLRSPKPRVGLRRWFVPALWTPALGAASLALGVLAGVLTSQGAGHLTLDASPLAELEPQAAVEPRAAVDSKLDEDSLGTDEPADDASLESLLALAWGEEANAWEAAWSSE
jgi:hypothetical protein